MTGRRTTTIATGALTGLLLLDSGCGQAANKAIGHETGMSVKSSKDGNNVSLKTKDGSYTYGSDAKLPADWPAGVVLPKGAKITSSTSTKSNGATNKVVTATMSGNNGHAAYAKVKSSLSSAGYSTANESETNSAGSYIGDVSGTKGKTSVDVTVVVTNGKLMLTYAVEPATP